MKWRRRQYLIDQRFQWRFVRCIIIPMVLGVIVITLADYYFIWSYFTAPSQVRYQNMGPISMKIAGYLLFYELVLLIPILTVIGVIFSHRVAGPLVNIERTLRAIGDGDLSKRVVLREKDELRALEMSVNEMAAGLADKFLEIEKAITVLQDKLLRLAQETGKELPNINKVREEIKFLSSSLDILKNSLGKFRR